MAHLDLHTTLEPRGPAAAIVLTEEQLGQLTTARTLPVVVTIDGRSARLRVARMGDEFLIGFSKAARAVLGVEIGDVVDARIEPDVAERTVEVPPALAAALAADVVARKVFDDLSYSRRKEIATSIADAKQEGTRQRRLAKALDELGAPTRPPRGGRG